ncbi:endonuclease/exonuclease/phosphatase family protein [Sphingomonas sp. NPDC079357]|uniref:endonuclease/exonuclease/phosphatase family protein n=1 Tax=Sphingomonas sp. NPDC079357 TaxID=3364518 RepID=UPI00384E3E00
MRIVSWNCNGAFRRKFDRIGTLNADVYVIQECENPATSTAEYSDWSGDYVWAGKSDRKGIGIFVKNGLSVQALDWPNYGLEQFIPVRIADRINLLAVWTKNSANMAYIGQFYQYLQHHSALLDPSVIICGDFNSNAIWDKRGRVWNHSECVLALSRLGFDSLYHHAMAEQQGLETHPTFYLQRNMGKAYHIDYFFAHVAMYGSAPSITVGKAAEWLAISDHMPVLLTI